jgi:hypothetical protein
MSKLPTILKESSIKLLDVPNKLNFNPYPTELTH